MPNGLNSRMALIGLTGFVGGAAITAALFELLFLTDLSSVVVILGLSTGLVAVLAAMLLIANAQVGAQVALLAGLLSIVVGVVEIALVGLTYSAPAATQPAWVQEFFNIIAGAFIGGIALRQWRPTSRTLKPIA